MGPLDLSHDALHGTHASHTRGDCMEAEELSSLPSGLISALFSILTIRRSSRLIPL